MRRSLVWVALVPLVLMCAGCDDDSDSGPTGSSGTPTSLEGTWSGIEEGGTATWVWVFAGNTARVQSSGNEVYSGTFATNSTFTPPRITTTITSSVYASYVGQSSRGIYQLSGDSLIIAANEPGTAVYPDDFTATAQTRVFLLARQ